MLKSNKKGVLIVISSPSGAGKTTIAKKLANKKNNIELSVSLTTRKSRLTEHDGIDYHFVTKKYFKNKIKNNSFLEYAEVFGNFYGTLKSNIIKKLKSGNNILLDIDWQGARQVKKKIPKDLITIFILPPSIKELRKRLKKRGESISFVNRRMGRAKKEIMHWTEYDYAIVNNNINNCVKLIKNIIQIDKNKTSRQSIVPFKNL